MNIEVMPLEEIRPYWRNPRKNEAAVESVAQSIRDYDYQQPIVIDQDNVIIAGHTRYKALLQLGYDEVHVVKSDMPPEKAKEYRVVDNKSGELSEWDWENLLPELREFNNIDDVQIHFPDLDLDALLSDNSFATPVSQPSQEHIEKRSGEMEERFTKKNTADLEGYVPLMCPECGEEFAVEKQDFLRRVEARDEG